MRKHRYTLVLFGGLAAVLLAGCKDEEVTSYEVPKTKERPRMRTVAVMCRQEGRRWYFPYELTWFFKLSGPEQDVEEYKAEFEQFLRSVRFLEGSDPSVTWQAPAGWEKSPTASKMRYATYLLGKADRPLEMTVTVFPGDGGTLLQNVNRWRGQIGLRDLTENELPRFCQEVQLDGVKATLVDLTIPGYKKPEGRP